MSSSTVSVEVSTLLLWGVGQMFAAVQLAVLSAACCSVNDVLGRYRQSLGVVMSMGAALKEHYGL